MWRTYRLWQVGSMREPKFSDAPCYGKEFNAKSKICGVCLANRLCEVKSAKFRRKTALAPAGRGLGEQVAPGPVLWPAGSN